MSDEYHRVVRGSLNLKGNSTGQSPKQPQKTASERAFEEAQERKLAEQVKKSHKERVAELNEKLSKLSEHHDIPKVGPG